MPHSGSRETNLAESPTDGFKEPHALRARAHASRSALALRFLSSLFEPADVGHDNRESTNRFVHVNHDSLAMIVPCPRL